MGLHIAVSSEPHSGQPSSGLPNSGPRASAQAGATSRETADLDDERLFAELYPGLRRLAGAVCPAHVDADDLVQEAVARVLRSKRHLSALDNPDAYLRRAIVRVASNERRSWRRGAWAFGRLRPQRPAPDELPSDLDVLMHVAPADRAVLYLSAVERLPYDEVAELLGCSEEAARTRASRARSRLRLLLEEEAEG